MCDTKDRYNFEQACDVLDNIDYYTADFKGTAAEYNGWTNYNTWLFNLNLTNEYDFIVPLESKIQEMSLKDFILYCLKKLWFFVDRIDFTEVNFKEVYTALKDDY